MADNVQGPDSVYPQGLPASYHCWLELPGELQRLPASLEEMAGDAGLIYCQAQQVSSRPQPHLQPSDAPSPLAFQLAPGLQRLTLYILLSRGLLCATRTRCPQSLPQACSLRGNVGTEQWHPFWEECPGEDKGQGYPELA